MSAFINWSSWWLPGFSTITSTLLLCIWLACCWETVQYHANILFFVILLPASLLIHLRLLPISAITMVTARWRLFLPAPPTSINCVFLQGRPLPIPMYSCMCLLTCINMASWFPLSFVGCVLKVVFCMLGVLIVTRGSRLLRSLGEHTPTLICPYTYIYNYFYIYLVNGLVSLGVHIILPMPCQLLRVLSILPCSHVCNSEIWFPYPQYIYLRAQSINYLLSVSNLLSTPATSTTCHPALVPWSLENTGAHTSARYPFHPTPCHPAPTDADNSRLEGEPMGRWKWQNYLKEDPCF